jgi:release factor glutamine methyltransferase
MEAIEAIVAGLPRGLATGGWLLLEHGATQGAAVRDCLRAAGLHSVSTLPDLQGLDRITLGQRR